jgi:transcriptional regulator with XRE-family HTH domain
MAVQFVQFRANLVKAFSEKLSEEIRTYREKHKLSQGDFGRKVGATKQAISDIEKGGRIPRREVLDKIWALISPEPATANHVQESPAPYGAAQPYLQWLREIIDSPDEYEAKIDQLYTAIDLERARLRRKKGKSA